MVNYIQVELFKLSKYCVDIKDKSVLPFLLKTQPCYLDIINFNHHSLGVSKGKYSKRERYHRCSKYKNVFT